jgi:hypothetical protein
MGAEPSRHRAVPDHRDHAGGVLGFKQLGQLEDPKFSVPSMT